MPRRRHGATVEIVGEGGDGVVHEQKQDRVDRDRVYLEKSISDGKQQGRASGLVLKPDKRQRGTSKLRRRPPRRTLSRVRSKQLGQRRLRIGCRIWEKMRLEATI